MLGGGAIDAGAVITVPHLQRTFFPASFCDQVYRLLHPPHVNVAPIRPPLN
jgi:hypothetical protein